MKRDDELEEQIQAAAALIAEADSLLITAGAGMGIDSGLPDFRGDNGFWKAYPALGDRRMRFYDIANPLAFEQAPSLAWGFYGHRLSLYRQTRPHVGFGQLLDLAARMPNSAFVFTSNVDGQFQRAGFHQDRVVECHGSIHWLQCSCSCGQAPWPADGFVPDVDMQTCSLRSDYPSCPSCGRLARPNILMFGDWEWDSIRVDRQKSRLDAWLARIERPVVLEIGAGIAIPTVRECGESLDCPLIRLNPVDAEVGLRRDI
ncbi:MAG: NAD-dependent deacetylase, partial [Paucimonas sp.]|nr:NAD-dependent deacetylase [Paucimonas sp.]